MNIHFVGATRITDTFGNDISPRGRKTRALLVVLATTPEHAVDRNRIASMLWSDRMRFQALSSLRQCVFELRGLRDANTLKTNRRRISLVPDTTRIVYDPTPDACDLFEDIEGCDPMFDEWLEINRPVWRDRAIAALTQQVALLDDMRRLEVAAVVRRLERVGEDNRAWKITA